jgi:hypothetical protein
MLGKKTDGLLINWRILKLIFSSLNSITVAQLYGLPHGILGVFNIIFYENEFQNSQIFQQTNNSLFPEQSTLAQSVTS